MRTGWDKDGLGWDGLGGISMFLLGTRAERFDVQHQSSNHLINQPTGAAPDDQGRGGGAGDGAVPEPVGRAQRARGRLRPDPHLAARDSQECVVWKRECVYLYGYGIFSCGSGGRVRRRWEVRPEVSLIDPLSLLYVLSTVVLSVLAATYATIDAAHVAEAVGLVRPCVHALEIKWAVHD